MGGGRGENGLKARDRVWVAEGGGSGGGVRSGGLCEGWEHPRVWAAMRATLLRGSAAHVDQAGPHRRQEVHLHGLQGRAVAGRGGRARAQRVDTDVASKHPCRARRQQRSEVCDHGARAAAYLDAEAGRERLWRVGARVGATVRA